MVYIWNGQLGNGYVLWNICVLWFYGNVEQSYAMVHCWNESNWDLSYFGDVWFMELVMWCENVIVLVNVTLHGWNDWNLKMHVYVLNLKCNMK